MPDTWSHLCNASNLFSTLLLTQDCKACGTDFRVQTLRLDGYKPSGQIKQKVIEEPSLRTKLAALFRPKPTRYEHEEDYNDRHG